MFVLYDELSAILSYLLCKPSRDRHSAFQNRLFVKSFWTSWPPRSWPRPTSYYYSPCWQNWELLRNFGWFNTPQQGVWENSQNPIRKKARHNYPGKPILKWAYHPGNLFSNGPTIQENLFSNGPTIQANLFSNGPSIQKCYSHTGMHKGIWAYFGKSNQNPDLGILKFPKWALWSRNPVNPYTDYWLNEKPAKIRIIWENPKIGSKPMIQKCQNPTWIVGGTRPKSGLFKELYTQKMGVYDWGISILNRSGL